MVRGRAGRRDGLRERHGKHVPDIDSRGAIGRADEPYRRRREVKHAVACHHLTGHEPGSVGRHGAQLHGRPVGRRIRGDREPDLRHATGGGRREQPGDLSRERSAEGQRQARDAKVVANPGGNDPIRSGQEFRTRGGTQQIQRRRCRVAYTEYQGTLTAQGPAVVNGLGQDPHFRTGTGRRRHFTPNPNGGSGGRLVRERCDPGDRHAELIQATVVCGGDIHREERATGQRSAGRRPAGEGHRRWLIRYHRDRELRKRALIAEAINRDGPDHHAPGHRQRVSRIQVIRQGLGKRQQIGRHAHARPGFGHRQQGLDLNRGASHRRHAGLDAQVGDFRSQGIQRMERSAERLVNRQVAGQVAHTIDGRRIGRVDVPVLCGRKDQHAVADADTHVAGHGSPGSTYGHRHPGGPDRLVERGPHHGAYVDLFGADAGCQGEQVGWIVIARGKR